MARQSELVIVFPQGHSKEYVQEFMGRCICWGLDFYFDKGDTLPNVLPPDIKGLRAIVIDRDDLEKNKKLLDEYRRNGTRVYVLQSSAEAVVPAEPNTWISVSRLQTLVFDANLTVESAQFKEKMCARSDEFIFDELAKRMVRTNDLRWYDATRYNWESLVDAYEITGETYFLDTVHAQIRQAMTEQENDCKNCDRISGLLPAMRVHEIIGDEEICKYAKEKVKLYLKVTPKYRGCLVNFTVFPNTVRSEIVWHVCPTLLMLSRITGDDLYAKIAMEQFERINELLLCSKTGLYHHGFADGGPTAAFWARGVSFVFLGLLTMLEEADPNDKRFETIREVFVNMAKKVKQFQDDSGFWFSRLDTPDSEKESSGTAWATACFYRAVRHGFLDTSYLSAADAGWNAVKSRVWRGNFPGTAMATTTSKFPSYYAKTPLNTIGWTHFAFRAACERRKLQMEENK